MVLTRKLLEGSEYIHLEDFQLKLRPSKVKSETISLRLNLIYTNKIFWMSNTHILVAAVCRNYLNMKKKIGNNIWWDEISFDKDQAQISFTITSLKFLRGLSAGKPVTLPHFIGSKEITIYLCKQSCSQGLEQLLRIFWAPHGLSPHSSCLELDVLWALSLSSSSCELSALAGKPV